MTTLEIVFATIIFTAAVVVAAVFGWRAVAAERERRDKPEAERIAVLSSISTGIE
jgi:membrane protein implicated in regulation of membrane protease activity